MLHDNDSPVVVVYPSRRKIRLVVSIFLGLILLATSVAVYVYSLKSAPQETDISEVLSDQAVESASSTALSVFQLTLVPDATSSIVLSLPTQTDASKKKDRAAYDAARVMTENQNDESVAAVIDGPYSIEVDLVSAMRELQLSDSAAMLYKVQDELLALTQYFNTELQQQSPVARGVADTVESPYDAAIVTTAPSSHVVLAYFMGDILKKSTLVQSDKVDKTVNDFITRGVGYGLYSMSDIEVSKSLYTQYKKLVITTYPELSNSF